MTVEPDEDYVIPFGKARIVQEAEESKIKNGESVVVVTYGRGVYWTLEAAQNFPGQVEIIDLRTLSPWDEETVFNAVHKHSKCVLVTEENCEASFTLGVAGKIQKNCFKSLDAPVEIVGSLDTPAIPLNSILEAAMLNNADKVKQGITNVLSF
jgi:2-oxoisovalerate dehydrogenase E1 component